MSNYATLRQQWMAMEALANEYWDAGKYRESIDARKKSYLLYNAMVCCPNVNTIKV